MANQIIRQEINLTHLEVQAASGASATTTLFPSLNVLHYSNAKFYFEIVTRSSVSMEYTVTLNGSVDGALAVINVPLGTTSTKGKVKRSNVFSPTTKEQTCSFTIGAQSGGSKIVISAAIVIIQNGEGVVNTCTSIEIGGGASTTLTSLTGTGIYYWRYTATNWRNITAAFFEATVSTASSKSAITVTLEVDDGNYSNWTEVVSITSVSTTPVNVKSANFTLTNHRTYRLLFKSSSTKNSVTINGGSIRILSSGAILDQFVDVRAGSNDLRGGNSAGGQIQQAIAQSFSSTSSYGMSGITILNVGKSGSPTDGVYLDIVANSISSSTILTTSKIISASFITSSYHNVHFPLLNNVAITPSQKYFFRIFRTGNRSDVDFILLGTSTNPYPSNDRYLRSNNIWTGSVTNALPFKIHTKNTKFESQYYFHPYTTNDILVGWNSGSDWNNTVDGFPVFKYGVDAVNSAARGDLFQVSGSPAKLGKVTGSGASAPFQVTSSAFQISSASNNNVLMSRMTALSVVGRMLVMYTTGSNPIIISGSGYAYVQCVFI